MQIRNNVNYKQYLKGKKKFMLSWNKSNYISN